MPRNSVCEFGNMQVKIVYTSFEKVLPFFYLNFQESFLSGICGGVTFLGEKINVVWKIQF